MTLSERNEIDNEVNKMSKRLIDQDELMNYTQELYDEAIEKGWSFKDCVSEVAFCGMNALEVAFVVAQMAGNHTFNIK